MLARQQQAASGKQQVALPVGDPSNGYSETASKAKCMSTDTTKLN